MSQQQPGTKMSISDFRAAVNLGTWISHLLSLFVNVFLHIAPGERYIGLPGLIMIPAMGAYAIATQRSGGAMVAALIPPYMLMCIIWHFWAVYRHNRLKIRVHTRYCGKPLILFLFPRWKEAWVKKAEPFIVIMVGIAVARFNQALGGFLCIAALGQGMSLAIARMMQRKRELDQMDAMLEQQELAASAREMRS